MKPRRLSFPLAAATAALLTSPHVFADNLTWDAGNTGNGATIDALSGNWNTTAGNIVWNNAGSNVPWSQTATNDASNAAIFAGTDGTLNQYVVTIGGTTMAAESVTFNSSGYQITGGILSLQPAATGNNGAIIVAANKTATISSAIAYNNNTGAVFTVNTGGILNLGGGASNAQYQFGGGGTVNMTAGTYQANTGNVNVATFNQTGGTFNPNQGNTVSYTIGSAAGQNVNYTISGGNLTSNANNAAHTDSRLVIGATTGVNTATLTVKTGATVAVGTTAAGQLRIGGDANSNGVLDVQGGTLTVGTNKPLNQLYFFVAGADASRSAVMTQSGGTVTTGGIQFGGSSGTYNAASSATLTLSAGSLYIGTLGITRGSAAAALPVTIQLQGGTLGADQNWSSSLDMKLGTTAGGPTIRAQDSASNARNITLSGVLSNDGAVAGTLTKTGTGTLTLSGPNTFTGNTLVSAGKIALGHALALQNSAYDTASVNGGLDVTGFATPTLGGLTGSVNLSSTLITGYGSISNLTLNPQTGITKTYSGDVGNGNGSMALTKSGAGTQILSGTNTYGGNTTISAGTLRLGASGVIPNASSVSVSGTGTLDLNGFNETIKGLSGAGTVDNTAAGNSILTVNDGGNFSGNITDSGAGTLALVKSVDGDLVLSGNNTYTGGTTLNANRIFIAGANALPTTGAVQVNGGTLNFNVGGNLTFNQSITLASGATLAMRQAATLSNVNLPTAGTVTFNNDDTATVAFSLGKNVALTGNLTVQVGGNNATVGAVTLGGNISGGFGLTKTQTGTLVLSGNSNSYTGATTVEGGKLLINGNVTTSITVKSTATLGGNFTTTGGLIIESGGTLSTGNSIGSDIAATVGYDSGSTTFVEMNSSTQAADLLTLTGTGANTLTITNGALLTLGELGTPGSLALRSRLTLIDYLASGVTGWNGGLFTFGANLLNDGEIFNALGYQFAINYDDTMVGGLSSPYGVGDVSNGGTYVTLTVVPEPRAALLGGLGMLALLRRRRN
jgi:autotransporter-associated beta strand protein